MLTIGISGGIASGKSTVVERFKFHGACAIHSDQIVHEVLERPEIIEQVRAHWRIDREGVSHCDRFESRLLMEGGKLKRSAVAAVVFKHTDELAFLEAITAEPVDARIRAWGTLFDNGYNKVTVLDIPLLFEYAYNGLCHYLIFVDCEPAKRVHRYAQRTRLSESEAKIDMELRENRQTPLKNKKQFSKTCFDNNGSQEQLIAQVDAFWKQLESQRFSAAYADEQQY